MADQARPIPAALLDLLRRPWRPDANGQVWDAAWDNDDPDRQTRPAYYFLRSGPTDGMAPLSRQQAEALVACGLLAGLAHEEGKVLAVNEHAAHAIQDF